MTTSELQASVRERDGVSLIDLTGDVNAGAEQALNDAYPKATSGGADSVVLNFERADYINSTGIALIVGLLAEAAMNAMEHGNEYRADRPVSIRVLLSADRLSVQVSDQGDPGELPEPETPDLQAKLEGRQKPRGWGLFLIEKMVDEARVTSEAGRHTVELALRLEGVADDDE